MMNADKEANGMIYVLGVVLLLVAVWFLLMGVRAMWGSAVGGGISSSPGITLDEEDAADLAAFGRGDR